ncbi:PREDICTED: clusterin isoform X2 [Myotis brandtii]|uniref:clusterin isoform X2 n=1 Tax=Myotis brandtii TaxID=109478 RepID=UPI0007041FC1|nr:PREDICTED: clusterin isoform X2 [Myotis brandtii]
MSGSVCLHLEPFCSIFPGKACWESRIGGKMKTLLLLVGLLMTWENGQVLGAPAVSQRELQEMSTEGSKYVNKEIKNAFKEVKHIKSLIDHTNDERKSLLLSLEEAKKKKEDALTDTKDAEMKLKASQEVCNDTMLSLWEECKPCLKQTCMKFYARVCRSSSGLVGHQLEEFLNQSSPFYFWMNGDRIDSLLENDRQQAHVLDTMEDRFEKMSSIMDEFFHNSFFNREPLDPFHFPPFGSSPRRPLFFSPKTRFARNLMPFPMFGIPNFQDMFRPFQDMFQDMMHQAQQTMDSQLQEPLFEFPMVEFPEENDNRTICKEIRHNSTGCLKMKDQCAKCQEILSVDCSGSNPAQNLLREELNSSLELAEKLARQYDELLRSYQQKMLNTSALLKQLNEQFNWVSQLANLTQREDQYSLHVTTVASRGSDSSVPSGFTKVILTLFDSDPITVTVPEVSIHNPKFMETVAEKALQEYRQSTREK